MDTARSSAPVRAGGAPPAPIGGGPKGVRAVAKSSTETEPAATQARAARVYDVFLSHRGPDVKRHFCEFLSEALRRAGVLAFVDEADLKPGDDAWPTMKTALESAHLVLPVFSKSYAESHWCLDELVLMMRKPEKVMPVFYDVGPNLDDLAKKAERYARCPRPYRIAGRRIFSPSCVMRWWGTPPSFRPQGAHLYTRQTC